MELIKPDISANSFRSGSGIEYIVYPSVSTERFPILEKMQVEMQFGISVSGFRQEIHDTYDLQNKSKFADVSVRLNNVLNGVARIDNNEPHPLLRLCTLFICPADEDQSKWNEADARVKIDDWAGVDVAFFLASARRFLSQFMTAYNIDSHGISAAETKEEGESE